MTFKEKMQLMLFFNKHVLPQKMAEKVAERRIKEKLEGIRDKEYKESE